MRKGEREGLGKEAKLKKETIPGGTLLQVGLSEGPTTKKAQFCLNPFFSLICCESFVVVRSFCLCFSLRALKAKFEAEEEKFADFFEEVMHFMLEHKKKVQVMNG